MAFIYKDNSSSKFSERDGGGGHSGGLDIVKRENERDKLLNQLWQIDRKYSTEFNQPTDFPDSLGTKRTNISKVSAQKAKQDAQTEIAKTYEQLRAKAEEASKKKSDSLLNDIEQLSNQKQNQLGKLAAQLREQLEEAQKKSIEQNIARSSIASAIKEGVKEENEFKKEEMLTENAQKNSLLENTLKQLEEQKALELSNLQNIYDADLAKQVKKILEENKQDILENERYNNSLNAAEAKFDASNQKAMIDAVHKEYTRVLNMMKLIDQMGQDTVEEMMLREKLNAMKNLFGQMEKEDATVLFESQKETLEYHLGIYFDALESFLATK